MIERAQWPSVWPSYGTLLDLPYSSRGRFVTLQQAPSSYLWLVDRRGVETPILVGEPHPVEPGQPYRLRAAAHPNETVGTPAAAGTVLAYRDRMVAAVLSELPIVGGSQRLQLRISGNTATIGSTWLLRVATRYLRSFHVRARVAGDTVNVGLYGMDEAGDQNDGSDYVPGVAPNVANNTGVGLGAALDHTPIYGAATYQHENLGDHMAVVISSTYAAGTSLRVSCVGRR